jgi:hypothetical protein
MLILIHMTTKLTKETDMKKEIIHQVSYQLQHKYCI